jgi:hypothetical protein
MSFNVSEFSGIERLRRPGVTTTWPDANESSKHRQSIAVASRDVNQAAFN